MISTGTIWPADNAHLYCALNTHQCHCPLGPKLGLHSLQLDSTRAERFVNKNYFTRPAPLSNSINLNPNVSELLAERNIANEQLHLLMKAKTYGQKFWKKYVKGLWDVRQVTRWQL